MDFLILYFLFFLYEKDTFGIGDEGPPIPPISPPIPPFIPIDPSMNNFLYFLLFSYNNLNKGGREDLI